MSTVIFQAQFQEAGVALTSGDLVGGDVPTVSVAGFPRNGDPAFIVVAGAAATYYATSKTWRYRNAALDTVLNQYVANFNTTYAAADQIDLPALGEADFVELNTTVTAAITAGTLVVTNAITAATLVVTNAITAGTLVVTNAISALGVVITGQFLVVTNAIAAVAAAIAALPGLLTGLLTNLVCASVHTGAYIGSNVGNLAFERWTTNEVACSVTRGGAPYDLTGASLLWVAGTGPTLSKSTAAATITVDVPATAGVFRFTITAADSLLFTSGDLDEGVEHQCKVRDVAGNVYNVFEGRLRFDDTLIVAI